MNNNVGENNQQTNENVVKPVSAGGEVPATADAIVKQAEQEAAHHAIINGENKTKTIETTVGRIIFNKGI